MTRRRFIKLKKSFKSFRGGTTAAEVPTANLLGIDDVDAIAVGVNAVGRGANAVGRGANAVLSPLHNKARANAVGAPAAQLLKIEELLTSAIIAFKIFPKPQQIPNIIKAFSEWRLKKAGNTSYNKEIFKFNKHGFKNVTQVQKQNIIFLNFKHTLNKVFPDQITIPIQNIIDIIEGAINNNNNFNEKLFITSINSNVNPHSAPQKSLLNRARHILTRRRRDPSSQPLLAPSISTAIV